MSIHEDCLDRGFGHIPPAGKRFGVAAFRYHDSYVRQDGAWRFRERRSKFLYVTPVQHLAEIFRTPLTLRWPGTEPAPSEL